MPNQFDEQDSLDRAVTRTGGDSRPDWLRPRPAGGTNASLGEQETGAESCSSLSDLADLGDDEDEPQEIVDLESRYEIMDVLGRGGMGEVVRAMDRRLKRQVAIKRMRAELGASRHAMRRFLTEAVSVAALNHFNVVQIYDYGHTTDGPFLVMELVEGPTLADRLTEGPLPLAEAIDVACQLGDGLQAAHDRGIIHRDIKPANILLTAAGTPKLTDFGLAKEAGDTGHTQAGAVLGTLDFMAPEQKADSSRADARSDQWSLAATFYQMVTGETPRIIDIDGVPESVRDVVRRALKTNPEERFESVREFGEALQDAINPLGEPALDRSKLQEGQCAACGTVNDASRKFCRDCGAGLQESCPECGGGTAVWERFCGECGIDISAAIESRLQSARDLVRMVQSLRTEYRHAEALEKIAPLLGLSHPALEEHREWAEKTRNQLAGELADLESQRNQLLQAAREQVEIGSFSAAGKYLARIPKPLQTGRSRELAEQLSAVATEAKQLAVEIGGAVRARKYEGLDDRLERYLELKPRDERARTLLEKVRQRSRRTQPELSAAATGEDEDVSARSSTRTERKATVRLSLHRLWLLPVCAAVLAAAGVWYSLAGGNGDPALDRPVVAASTQSKNAGDVFGATAADSESERLPSAGAELQRPDSLPYESPSNTLHPDSTDQQTRSANDSSSSAVDARSPLQVAEAPRFDGWRFYDVFGNGVSQEGVISVSEDGTLVFAGGIGGICVATRQKFSGYTLRFDYRMPSEDGSLKPFVGIAARLPNPGGNGWLEQFPFGIELKLGPQEAGMVVLPHPDFSVTLGPGQSRDDQDRRKVLPLRRPAVNLGDWNSVEIVGDDAQSMVFKINGTAVGTLTGVEKPNGHIVIWPGLTQLQIRNTVLSRNGVETSLPFHGLNAPPKDTAHEATESREESEPEEIILFDGNGLAEWRLDGDVRLNWRAVGNTLVFNGSKKVNLYTRRLFRNLALPVFSWPETT